MAKIARRSVASNPSSLTSKNSSPSSKLPSSSSLTSNISSSVHYKKALGENSYKKRSPNNNKNSPLPATPDPLRNTNYQLTTRTISNFNRNGSNKNGNFSSATNTTATATNRDFNSTLSAADILAAERERIRMEFYATYDVMTGVRIAATLGGFFGLMVFLVVYKSRNHSDDTLKVLKDPKIAAVAAACMQEEEEREIQQAIEATGLSIYPEEYENMMFRRQRMLSLGNVSAPPILHRYRFSSIGGGPYSSLLEPSRRYSYSGSRRRSGSESSRILGAYHMGSSFGTDDYFMETDDEVEHKYDAAANSKDMENESLQPQAFLGVPPTGQESRRSSAMTCCSTESSYLERRCSALNLGLMELPTTLQRRISSVSRRSSADIWDYYYPDIQIIQATPKTSPCLSERSVHDKIMVTTISTKNSPTSTSVYTTKSPMTVPITIATNGGNVISSSSYYAQTNKIFPKSDENYHCNRGSFVTEKRKIGHTLSADSSRKYDDNNELKLTVERKISDPSSIINNNNNNSYSNIYTSSYDSLQLFRNNGSDVKRAPLASLSSFKISSADYQDSDLKSLGSDSVFVESYADTDDDMEQFSTDSDELSASGSLDGEDEAIGPPRSSPQQLLPSSSSSTMFIAHKSQHPTATLQHQKLTDRSHQLQKIQQQHQQQFSTRSDPYSIKYSSNITGSANGKRIRSTLQRHHRTVSASSNDKILLISSSQHSSQEQPSSSSFEQHSSDIEYFNQKELPKTIYQSYVPPSASSSSTTIRQILSDSLPSKTGSITSDDIQHKGTGTGTTTSSCSSSHKTEIHRPSSSSLATTVRNVVSGVISRTSSFSYDNNNDSYSNRSGISSSSINKHYYSSRPQHYNDDDKENESKLSTSSNNSNEECVEVNVIIENRPTTNIISPSVILELPVITTTTVPSSSQVEDDPPRDPSLPGTSRKWSKETLF